MTGTYDVVARRDGRWWSFEIPALTSPSPRGAGHRIVAMGQARSAHEIDSAAREVVTLWAGEADVDLRIRFDLPAEIGATLERARLQETAGRAALGEAADLRRAAVRALRAGGMTQADASAVLGISRQRVSQLGR